eukprot:jgi/Bigna1/134688/aug1.26_g9396
MLRNLDHAHHHPAPNYALEATWAAFPTLKIREPPRAPQPLPSYLGDDNTIDDIDDESEEEADPTPGARCDVFFIPFTSAAAHSLPGHKGLLAWDDAVVAEEIPDVLSTQASAFASHCRVYAPRYRQPTGEAILNPEANQEAFDAAYSDIVNAFRFYMEYENNGAPYMIASNHQGWVDAV